MFQEWRGRSGILSNTWRASRSRPQRAYMRRMSVSRVGWGTRPETRALRWACWPGLKAAAVAHRRNKEDRGVRAVLGCGIARSSDFDGHEYTTGTSPAK